MDPGLKEKFNQTHGPVDAAEDQKNRVRQVQTKKEVINNALSKASVSINNAPMDSNNKFGAIVGAQSQPTNINKCFLSQTKYSCPNPIKIPKHSKHLLEAKEPRDKQDKIKKVGDSMGRWKEFMESGPDRLPTDESEDYDPDSADEILVAKEISK